jgi:putative membrane protein
VKYTKSHYPIILIKGMLMGIADLIPGVSGGTIALITGIYKDLISSLNNINFKNISKNLFTNFKSHKFDFLSVLIIGIGLSILLFSNIILFLLENYNNEISSFFFGLIICSIYVLLKKIKSFKIYDIFVLIFSSFLIFQLLKLNSLEQEINLTYVFMCGFLCSCAMILPGISGSYILLILGAYQFILKKLNDVFTQGSDSYLYVVTFILGAILGVITFSRVIKWLFKNFENRTLIVLIGFILGSVLNIVPYKTEDNESITSFLNFFKNDFSLVLWVFLGFVTIIILNIISKKK